jgi:hypothetical protein
MTTREQNTRFSKMIDTIYDAEYYDIATDSEVTG